MGKNVPLSGRIRGEPLLEYVSEALEGSARGGHNVSRSPPPTDATNWVSAGQPDEFLRQALGALVPLDSAEIPLSATAARRAARALAVLWDEHDIERRTAQEAVRLGGANLIGQRYARALSLFDEALAGGSYDFEARLGRSRALSHLWRDAEALQDCETAIAIRPNNANGLLEKSFILDVLEQPKEALRVCEAALKVSDRHHEPREFRAVLLAKAGRLDEALDDAEAARSMAPEESCAVLTHADVLSVIGRDREAYASAQVAKRLLNRSLQLDPQDLRSRSFMIPLLMWLGEPDEALEQCSQALRMAPHKHAWHLMRGDLYRRLHAPEKALQDFEAAASGGNVSKVRISTAMVMGQLDRWQDCLAWLKDVPLDSVRAAALRGVALSAAGEYEAALPLYDLALSADPHHREALYNRAWSLYELGRKREAMLGFRAFLEGHPDPRLGKRWAQRDPDLRKMREDPDVAAEFRSLMHDRFSLRASLRDVGLWRQRKW